MFSFKDTEIKDLILIEYGRFQDSRGYFMERYNALEFADAGITKTFVQDNFSVSKKNVIRGLHFQKKPFEQGKLVSVIKGCIFDVAVDIRKDSETFGKWVGIELSESNNRALWIPEGFAHGFATLEENTIVYYKTTNYYSKEHESGIIWNDKDIMIDWPIKDPILSEKDRHLPPLSVLAIL
jgi:dTDP-4-dehydrorhamnose 3,5-epimerase